MTYGSLSARFYDLCFPEPPNDALDFYLECARRAIGPILEPMCGSGRYLLPLLERGFDIEGMDASAEMLARCRARASARRLEARLHQGLLQSLQVPRKAGLVMIPAGSFCLVTSLDEVRQSLGRIHETLLPGGSFVVEIERVGFLEPSLDSTWSGRWLSEPDGTLIVQNVLHQYSGVEGIARALHRYELVSQGQLVATEFEQFAIRHYEPAAFETLLVEAGFCDIKVFAACERRALGPEDDAVLFECIRPN